MKYISHLVLLLGLFLFNTRLDAQVNIEKYRQVEDAGGFSGSFAFGAEAQTGNTDIQELAVEGRLDYVNPSVTTFILTNNDFGWEQGQRFSNEAVVHIRQMYRLREGLRLEVFGQYNFDKTIFINHRGLLGGGLRLRLLDKKMLKLWGGSGYMLEHERLGIPATGPHPDRTTVSRWTNYLSSRLNINDRLASAWTIYAQPRFRAMQDFRLLSNINIEVDLGGPVVLTLSFQMRYDSRPPGGIKKTDTKIEHAIAIVF
jgi:putative salt-induced outer membrane protein YdiY